jgi:steroid 5-alpha reductase family enzyme
VSLGSRIGIALATMVALMVSLWAVRGRRNAGVVDVAWSFGTGLTGVFFALTAGGLSARRIAVAALAGLWALRLGGYLLRRVSSEVEDVRYRALREKWGPRASRNFLLFFLVQAAWAVLFALPMLPAAENARDLCAADLAGVLLWLAALTGEAVADLELARFRADPANRGRVCRRGLWGWSRHPNYFFEWLGWWAYVLLAAGHPLWYLALGGPALMLLFLTRVTGIPPTEKRLLASRGESYREYQRSVSVFVPWPPKRAPKGG